MLLVLLLLLPFIEVYVFIQAVDEFGFLTMVVEALLSAWIGLTILRFRSLIIMGAVQKTLNRQVRPEDQMIESLLVFIGAVLMIIPGLVSDVVGFLCVLPPTRHLLAWLLRQRLSDMARNGRFKMVYKDVNRPGEGFRGQKRPEQDKYIPMDEGIRDVTPPSGAKPNSPDDKAPR